MRVPLLVETPRAAASLVTFAEVASRGVGARDPRSCETFTFAVAFHEVLFEVTADNSLFEVLQLGSLRQVLCLARPTQYDPHGRCCLERGTLRGYCLP